MDIEQKLDQIQTSVTNLTLELRTHLAQCKERCKRVDGMYDDLYGNGKPGIKARCRDNSRVLSAVLWIGGFITLAVVGELIGRILAAI